MVAFSTEMLPDTRIFYTDGRKHIGQSIREYLGDSRAHWEGEELVVETTNLTDKTAIGVNGNGVRHSTQMVITERFRRVADQIIQYQATYDDPVTYERPFTVSFPLTPLDGGVLLPYDCHPGNAAISMSLSAERYEDKAIAADRRKASSGRGAACRTTVRVWARRARRTRWWPWSWRRAGPPPARRSDWRARRREIRTRFRLFAAQGHRRIEA